MTIEFLPSDIRNRDITKRLGDSLINCRSVVGSIAYWTLGTKAINNTILQALSKPSSSMCVDLQWPTDLKKIAAFVNNLRICTAAPVMHICLRKNLYSREVVSKLHTKLLVFDMGDGNWEIWTGSHNFTESALNGSNLEATVCIHGRIDDLQFERLLYGVQNYLTGILHFCEPFDPQKLAYYEALQGKANGKDIIDAEHIIIAHVLSLQSELANQLAGQTIILLGNLQEELAYIRSRNQGRKQPVYLRVKDIHSGLIYTYEAQIRPNDLIDNASSSNVSFNDRRWATRNASNTGEAITPPILQQKTNVSTQIIRENKYYVNIELKRMFEEGIRITYYTYPEVKSTKLWRVVDDFQQDSNFNLFSLVEKKNIIERDGNFSRRKTKKRASRSLIPVENAEKLMRVSRIEWTDNFKDGLFDKQIIAFENKPK